MLINLTIVAFLLFANGFFVASEFALVAARKTRLSQLENEGNKEAKMALKAINRLDKTMATAQLGITISSIGLGWVGEMTFAKMFMPLFAFLPETINGFATHSISIVLAFSLVTLLHVVLGELMPRSVALHAPEKFSLIIARPMNAITKIFTPLVWIFNGLGNFLLSLIKIPPAHTGHIVHSMEEIDMIIDASHKEGVLNDTEKEILQNVFKFSDIIAKQVMVPRPDVIAIPINTTSDELNKIIMEHQYTRYPVYDDDLDHVLGLLHVKDVYPLICESRRIDLKNILREAILVPETITMDNLVLEFKKTKSQMAVVVDEFGSTSGIITLEDVIEEIFGEVQDEFDEEEADIRQIYENEFIANAMVRLDEFNEYFEDREIEVDFEDEDVETLGGLVVKYLGHIAKNNDEVEFDGFWFKVLETDGARVLKLKIRKLPEADALDTQE